MGGIRDIGRKEENVKNSYRIKLFLGKELYKFSEWKFHTDVMKV